MIKDLVFGAMLFSTVALMIYSIFTIKPEECRNGRTIKTLQACGSGLPTPAGLKR